jgi:hypothetical protein
MEEELPSTKPALLQEQERIKKLENLKEYV